MLEARAPANIEQLQTLQRKIRKHYKGYGNDNQKTKKKDPKLARAGVSGYNKPKRTPNHPTKKFVVKAKKGDKTKLISLVTPK